MSRIMRNLPSCWSVLWMRPSTSRKDASDRFDGDMNRARNEQGVASTDHGPKAVIHERVVEVSNDQKMADVEQEVGAVDENVGTANQGTARVESNVSNTAPVTVNIADFYDPHGLIPKVVDLTTLLSELWDRKELVSMVTPIRELTSLISHNFDAPLFKIRESNILPILVVIIHDYSLTEPQLVAEATCLIGSYAERDERGYLVELGVVPLLYQLLSVPNPSIIENSLLALVNIARYVRGVVQSLHPAPLLCKFVEPDQPLQVRQNAIELAMMLCSDDPTLPPAIVLLEYLPLVTKVLARKDLEDDTIIKHAMWTASCITFRNVDAVATYPHFLEDIIDIVNVERASFGLSLIDRILALGADPDAYMIRALDAGLLPAIEKTIKSENKFCIKLAFDVIKSVAGGSGLVSLLDQPQILDGIGLTLVKYPMFSAVRDPALGILAVVISQATEVQLLQLLRSVPVPLQLSLHIIPTSDLDYFRILKTSLTTLLNKVGLKACLDSCRDKDDRYRKLVCDEYSTIEDLWSLSKEFILDEPALSSEIMAIDWMTLLVAWEYDVSQVSKYDRTKTVIDEVKRYSPKGYCRLRQIKVMTMLVGTSTIPRLRPSSAIWPSKDVWISFCKYYLDPAHLRIDLG